MNKCKFLFLVGFLILLFSGCSQSNDNYELGSHITNEISASEITFSEGKWKVHSESIMTPLQVGEYTYEIEGGTSTVYYYFAKQENISEMIMNFSGTNYDSEISGEVIASSSVSYYNSKDEYDKQKKLIEDYSLIQSGYVEYSFDDENFVMLV